MWLWFWSIKQIMRHIAAENAEHTRMIKMERIRYFEFIFSILELAQSGDQCIAVASFQRTLSGGARELSPSQS